VSRLGSIEKEKEGHGGSEQVCADLKAGNLSGLALWRGLEREKERTWTIFRTKREAKIGGNVAEGEEKRANGEEEQVPNPQ